MRPPLETDGGVRCLINTTTSLKARPPHDENPNTILQREANPPLKGPTARTRDGDGCLGAMRHWDTPGNGSEGWALRTQGLHQTLPIQLTGSSTCCDTSPGGRQAGLQPRRRRAHIAGRSPYHTLMPQGQDSSPPCPAVLLPLPGAGTGQTHGCLVLHIPNWIPELTGPGFESGPRSHGWFVIPAATRRPTIPSNTLPVVNSPSREDLCPPQG